MRTALLIVMALAAAGSSGAAAAADVWKWVDEKGITHYSDQPVPGATKIEVRAGNVSSSAASSTAPSNSPTPSSAPASAPNYRNFEIVQPQANQSFINTGGQVNVEIRIEPNVDPLHTLSLWLDGKMVGGFPHNTLSYDLHQVPRGAHSLTAVVEDQNGRTVIETPAVVFNVRQESIANPPVGPTLRPPPKPQPRAQNKVLTTQPSYGALNGAPAAINPATNMPATAKAPPKPKKP